MSDFQLIILCLYSLFSYGFTLALIVKALVGQNSVGCFIFSLIIVFWVLSPAIFPVIFGALILLKMGETE